MAGGQGKCDGPRKGLLRLRRVCFITVLTAWKFLKTQENGKTGQPAELFQFFGAAIPLGNFSVFHFSVNQASIF
jgi:hypothetical protein